MWHFIPHLVSWLELNSIWNASSYWFSKSSFKSITLHQELLKRFAHLELTIFLCKQLYIMVNIFLFQYLLRTLIWNYFVNELRHPAAKYYLKSMFSWFSCSRQFFPKWFLRNPQLTSLIKHPELDTPGFLPSAFGPVFVSQTFIPTEQTSPRYALEFVALQEPWLRERTPGENDTPDDKFAFISAFAQL